MKKTRFGKTLLVLVLLTGVFFALAGCKKKPGEGGDIVIIPTTESTAAQTESTTPAESTTPKESTTAQETTTQEVSTTEQETTTQEVSTTEQETTTPAETTTEQDTTMQETTETSQTPTVAEAKPWDLLNNEPLNPATSGYEELDNLIAGYMTMLKNEGTLTDDMSPYQTVHSIYVWFIKRITYNRGMNVDAGKYSTSDPATTPEEVLWATDLFNTYQGCCYNYSSAFMYIMRYLGYDAHLLSGQVSSYGGGTTPHCWLYVNLGGTAYTFDPDVDMNYYWRNLKEGGTDEKTDTLFCRKMDDMSYFYTIEKYHTN